MDNFLNSIKDVISETAKSAVKKSNKIVETTKIKLAISDAEADIARNMKDIGELIYDAYKKETEPSETLKEKCELIDEKYQNIEDLRSKLCELKEIKICPSCKKETEPEAVFCSQCGEKFE